MPTNTSKRKAPPRPVGWGFSGTEYERRFLVQLGLEAGGIEVKAVARYMRGERVQVATALAIRQALAARGLPDPRPELLEAAGAIGRSGALARLAR